MADGPIRAPLHKQQPCCLQTPVPASCQCFVVQKSSPLSDVAVPRTRGSEAAAGNLADLRMRLAAATEDVNMPAAASKLGAEAQATAEKLAVVNQRIKAAEDQAAEGKEEVKEAKKETQKEEEKADEAKEEEAAEKTQGKSDEKARGRPRRRRKRRRKRSQKSRR